jgi:cystathionine beta-lyase/cystathionine gamma-synthase
VIDLAAVAQALAGTGVLLAVDNTLLTPLLQRPLELGADLVVHSATKFLSGHNDTLAGAVVTRTAGLGERLRAQAMAVGNVLAPFDCFLVERGLKTLAVRMERAQATAGALAAWLEAHPLVQAVAYPGLASHPGHDLLARQAAGFGAMVSFRVGSAQSARAVLGAVKLIQFAESLGGTETLITYPAFQTHCDVPEPERLALGIDDRLLRLSVGLEAFADLRDDLAQALGDG